MYKIKQIPEDFVVREISGIRPSEHGKYTYFLLKKRNYTTQRAVKAIADALHIPEKRFGFAGNKDKNAITEQLCSVDVDSYYPVKWCSKCYGGLHENRS